MLFFCFSGTVGVKRRGGPGGLNKVCGVSPELQAIVGEPALPRTEVVISRSTQSSLYWALLFCTLPQVYEAILILILKKLWLD